MSTYQIQGEVDGQWSWMHVGDSESACTFETRDEAQEALNSLAETTDFGRLVRIVEVE